MEPKDESEGDDQVMLDASGVFCKKLSTKIREIFDECPAGPASYWARHVNSVEAKQAFVSWLWENFPERSDILYVHDVDAAPRVTENDLAQSPPAAFHVASLAFSDLSSIKPPPGKELAVQLIDFFLKEGFVTSGEPLLISMPESLVEENRGVTSPWDSEGKVTLAPFSVGYVKGRARATSLLALLHVMYSDATFSNLFQGGLGKPLPQAHRDGHFNLGTRPSPEHKGRRGPDKPETQSAGVFEEGRKRCANGSHGEEAADGRRD